MNVEAFAGCRKAHWAVRVVLPGCPRRVKALQLAASVVTFPDFDKKEVLDHDEEVWGECWSDACCESGVFFPRVEEWGEDFASEADLGPVLEVEG